MMTPDDIATVLAANPELTEYGMGVPRDVRTPEDVDTYLRASRLRLLNRAAICSRLCGWLAGLERTKNVNGQLSSYDLKHLAEAALGGYVANGEVIVAALHTGLKMKVYPGSPNVSFNVRVPVGVR